MARFECFLEANELQGVSDNRKRAYFLSHCGPEVFDTTESLSEPTPVQSVPWQTLQTMLRAHYAPVPSKFVQRFELRQRVQREGESISVYMAALRKAATHCEYRDLEDTLLEQLICGVRDIRLQRRLLSKSNLTLAMALDEARAHEMSTKAAETLQKPNTPNAAAKATPVHSEEIQAESNSEEEEEVFHTGRPERGDRDECVSCGGQHQRQNCRFKDAICRRCEKKGHIAQACRAPQPSRPKFKPANQQGARSAKQPGIGQFKKGAKLNQTTVRVGHASTRLEKKIFTKTYIEGVQCKMEVDTGSSIMIMSWDTIARDLPDIAKRQLQPQKLRVQDYQGNRIPVRGVTSVRVKYGQFKKTLPITIVDGNLPSLLGLDWFRALGMGITGVHRSGVKLKDKLLREFEDVFQDSLGN
ncbi:uncharacterized protein LOC131188905 [Ahaetulla prasina]|uniref:uncharacterized protein LOC131188905 n=1 Tax=Ahaetulla prasina TaxID=499056 RepID=UPI0026486715|nr:uncharacterized protein LOC131188905 [Ahaetulla prasina]